MQQVMVNGVVGESLRILAVFATTGGCLVDAAVAPAHRGMTNDQLLSPLLEADYVKRNDGSRSAQTGPTRSPKLPAPRDPEAAVQEQFELALQSSVEDLKLFVARYETHPLAARARLEIARRKRE